jgi:hypothetical protein
MPRPSECSSGLMLSYSTIISLLRSLLWTSERRSSISASGEFFSFRRSLRSSSGRFTFTLCPPKLPPKATPSKLILRSPMLEFFRVKNPFILYEEPSPSSQVTCISSKSSASKILDTKEKSVYYAYSIMMGIFISLVSSISSIPRIANRVLSRNKKGVYFADFPTRTQNLNARSRRKKVPGGVETHCP